jgi:hypothetical protein
MLCGVVKALLANDLEKLSPNQRIDPYINSFTREALALNIFVDIDGEQGDDEYEEEVELEADSQGMCIWHLVGSI